MSLLWLLLLCTFKFSPVFSGDCVALSLVFCAVCSRPYFCLFITFFVAILSVLRFTVSDYPFGIFKLFLIESCTNLNRINMSKIISNI